MARSFVYALLLAALVLAVEALVRFGATLGLLVDPALDTGIAEDRLHLTSSLEEVLARYSPKPEGGARVAIVGDSFSFPTAISDEDCFPRRLERILRSPDLRGAPGGEVVRFGEGRLNAVQKVVHLRKAIASGADVILLELDFDDPDLERGQRATNRNAAARSSYSWKSFALLRDILLRGRNARRKAEHAEQLFFSKPTWDNFADAMRLVRQLADESNVPVIALVFPSLSVQPDPEYAYARIHLKIADFLSSVQIPTLDLLPEYTEIPLARLTAGRSEGSELAHEIAARRIDRFLREHKLLPDKVTVEPSQPSAPEAPTAA